GPAAVPPGPDGDLAQADRDREREGPARAGARPHRPRPRQGGRVPRRRDGRGDKALRMTPRAGIDRAAVVAAAGRIAGDEGPEAVTLTRVASDLGVRPPSLYNHIECHGALMRALGIEAVEELATAITDAAVGRSREDALRALAVAYRAYALAHPGRYALTV